MNKVGARIAEDEVRTLISRLLARDRAAWIALLNYRGITGRANEVGRLLSKRKLSSGKPIDPQQLTQELLDRAAAKWDQLQKLSPDEYMAFCRKLEHNLLSQQKAIDGAGRTNETDEP